MISAKIIKIMLIPFYPFPLGSTKTPVQLPPVVSPHKTLAKTNINKSNKTSKRTKLPPVK